MATRQSTPAYPATATDRLLNGLSRAPSGCWVWSGNRTGDGYGRITVRNRDNRTHRLSYELFCGPIPDGLGVLHKCDNPPCCNPTHLFLGTTQDNTDDRLRKGRRLPQLKLSEEQRRAIREEYRRGTADRGVKYLAAKYGVGLGTIHRTLNHKLH